MIKGYCIAKFLSEENIRTIREVSAGYGYDMTFFDSTEEAEGKVSDGEVIYCTNPRLLPQMPGLRWCHTSSAGADNFIRTGIFDCGYPSSKNDGRVLLTNSSGAYGLAISEYIIMTTLMLLRRMPEYRMITDSREWRQHLAVRTIEGSSIAIIGTGNIGSTAAAKFKALGAACVIGFSRTGTHKEPFDRVYRIEEFETVMKEGTPRTCSTGSSSVCPETDVVVMCIPGTPETQGIMDAEKIEAIPETAFLINTGRGTTVDQDALIKALNSGSIAGAALDVVFPEPLPADHPLWDAKNCIITPHMSGDMGLRYTNDVTVDIFCENLRRYAEGESLINIVDTAAGY